MTSENREEEAQGERKFIINEKKADDSWKEKARKEKEKLSRPPGLEDDPHGHGLPPASFHGLLEELALRAMMSLGQVRDPATGDAYLDLPTAKYVIDLLGVIEAKTRGNLDPNEEATLKDLLHNLRLAYVQISRSVSQSGMGTAARGSAPPAPPQSPGSARQPPGSASQPSGASQQPRQPPMGDKPGPKIII